MKESEILEYRKQVYNELSKLMNEEFMKMVDADRFNQSLNLLTERINMECDEQIKSREREASYRMLRSDIIRNAKDEQLKEARKYVPIPLSSYKDDAQERRTRPSDGEDAEMKRVSTRTKDGDKAIPGPKQPRVSSEDKNIAAMARAMGITDDEARAMLAAQRAKVTEQQPRKENEDEITPEMLEAEAEISEEEPH